MIRLQFPARPGVKQRPPPGGLFVAGNRQGQAKCLAIRPCDTNRRCRWADGQAGNQAPAAGLFGSEQMTGAHQRRLAPVKTAFGVSISIEGAATTTTVVRAPFNR